MPKYQRLSLRCVCGMTHVLRSAEVGTRIMQDLYDGAHITTGSRLMCVRTLFESDADEVRQYRTVGDQDDTHEGTTGVRGDRGTHPRRNGPRVRPFKCSDGSDGQS